MTSPTDPILSAEVRRMLSVRVAQVRTGAGILRVAAKPASPIRQAADELADASRDAVAVLRNPHLAEEDRERLLAAARRAHRSLGALELLAALPGPVAHVGRALGRLRDPIGDWLESLDAEDNEDVRRPPSTPAAMLGPSAH